MVSKSGLVLKLSSPSLSLKSKGLRDTKIMWALKASLTKTLFCIERHILLP